MSVKKITEKFCTNNSRYKAAQRYTPVGVVLHSIGCPQPKASALVSYWQNNGSPYMTHYILDDQTIYHCMPDNYKAWHVCSPGNSKWIGIEMGEPKQIKYTSGAKFTCSDLSAARAYATACYDNAVWLIAYLCKKYGWNPDTAIHTHYEVTIKRLSNTDHVDPEHLWNGLGLSYSVDTLRRDVKKEMGGSFDGGTPTDNRTLLKNGMWGEDVRKLQTDLVYLGYNLGGYSIDGGFGTYTELAVRAFQKDNGLVVDGIAGEKTLSKLKELVDKKKNGSSASVSYVAKVTASVLNVRSGPGTNYKVVNTLNKGGAYTIVEENNGWGLLKAYSQNKNGWVSLEYMKKI